MVSPVSGANAQAFTDLACVEPYESGSIVHREAFHECGGGRWRFDASVSPNPRICMQEGLPTFFMSCSYRLRPVFAGAECN